jgi:hypothetical protein
MLQPHATQMCLCEGVECIYMLVTKPLGMGTDINSMGPCLTRVEVTWAAPVTPIHHTVHLKAASHVIDIN